MKKLILATIVAIAGWFTIQAQSLPAPEKYNNLLEQMSQLDQTRAEFLMHATMETLAKDPKGYRQMMELAEKRFSDAADPLHNEGLYMTVLKHATENYVLSNAEKEKQRLLLEGARKNRIGSVAADFDYVTPGDKTIYHLKDLKADNILVFFNNPDCESCETTKERLASNELINQMINEKKLIVLAIYPYDDQKLWKKTKYPSMMINGWNQSRQIEYNELYDLPTLPCFYLLDNNFKVLIKNEGSLKKVEAKLMDLMTAKETGPAPQPPFVQEKPAAPAAQPASAPKTAPDHQTLKPRPQMNENAAAAHNIGVEADPAPLDDPLTIKSGEILNMFVNNQYNELYNTLSESLKATNKPETLDGALAKTEEVLGKYQSSERWEIRNFRGNKGYTALINFEKGKAGILIIYDEDNNVKAMTFLPDHIIKNMPAYKEK